MDNFIFRLSRSWRRRYALYLFCAAANAFVAIPAMLYLQQDGTAFQFVLVPYVVPAFLLMFIPSFFLKKRREYLIPPPGQETLLWLISALLALLTAKLYAEGLLGFLAVSSFAVFSIIFACVILYHKPQKKINGSTVQ